MDDKDVVRTGSILFCAVCVRYYTYTYTNTYTTPKPYKRNDKFLFFYSHVESSLVYMLLVPIHWLACKDRQQLCTLNKLLYTF